MLVTGLGRLFVGIISGQHFVHQGTNAIAVRSRNRNRLTKSESIEIRISGCRLKTLGLVDGQPRLLRMFAGKIGDMLVGSGDATSTINHDDRDIGLLQRLDGLLDHGFFDALLASG